MRRLKLIDEIGKNIIKIRMKDLKVYLKQIVNFFTGRLLTEAYYKF